MSRLLAAFVVLTLVSGCASRPSGSRATPAIHNEVGRFVAELEKPESGRMTRSNLLVRPDGVAETIEVTRLTGDYQVMVNLCQETRVEKERRLMDPHDDAPPAPATKPAPGTTCTYGRTFRFTTAKETEAFLKKALHVLGARSARYLLSTSSLL